MNAFHHRLGPKAVNICIFLRNATACLHYNRASAAPFLAPLGQPCLQERAYALEKRTSAHEKSKKLLRSRGHSIAMANKMITLATTRASDTYQKYSKHFCLRPNLCICCQNQQLSSKLTNLKIWRRQKINGDKVAFMQKEHSCVESEYRRRIQMREI